MCRFTTLIDLCRRSRRLPHRFRTVTDLWLTRSTHWCPLSAGAICCFWPLGGRNGCPRVWVLYCRCRRPSGARSVRPPVCLGHVFGARHCRPPPSRSLVRLFPGRLCRRRWIRLLSAHWANRLIPHSGGGPCPLSCALALGFFTGRLHVTRLVMGRARSAITLCFGSGSYTRKHSRDPPRGAPCSAFGPPARLFVAAASPHGRVAPFWLPCPFAIGRICGPLGGRLYAWVCSPPPATPAVPCLGLRCASLCPRGAPPAGLSWCLSIGLVLATVAHVLLPPAAVLLVVVACLFAFFSRLPTLPFLVALPPPRLPTRFHCCVWTATIPSVPPRACTWPHPLSPPAMTC